MRVRGRVRVVKIRLTARPLGSTIYIFCLSGSFGPRNAVRLLVFHVWSFEGYFLLPVSLPTFSLDPDFPLKDPASVQLQRKKHTDCFGDKGKWKKIRALPTKNRSTWLLLLKQDRAPSGYLSIFPTRTPVVFALALPQGINFAHFLCLSREDPLLVCVSPHRSRNCSPLLPRLRLLRRLCLCRLPGYQQEFPLLCCRPSQCRVETRTHHGITTSVNRLNNRTGRG